MSSSSNATAATHRSFGRKTITVGTTWAILLAILMAVLLFLDWRLMTRNGLLQSALSAREQTLIPQTDSLVPALDGVTPTGVPATVTYGNDARPTLLFIFSTECSVCDANWPSWESITKRIDETKYRIVYANLSRAIDSGYIKAHYFVPHAPIFAQLDTQTVVAYKLRLTPLLLLIGPDSRIRAVWSGMPKGATKHEMERVLGVE